MLVKARVNKRDDRVSLIVNDLAVPDLSAGAAARAPRCKVSMRTELCTPQRVSQLKEVLAHHPGTSEVHLDLVNGGRPPRCEARRRPQGHPFLGADGRSVTPRDANSRRHAPACQTDSPPDPGSAGRRTTTGPHRFRPAGDRERSPRHSPPSSRPHHRRRGVPRSDVRPDGPADDRSTPLSRGDAAPLSHGGRRPCAVHAPEADGVRRPTRGRRRRWHRLPPRGPTDLVANRTFERGTNERAAPARSCQLVELGDELHRLDGDILMCGS